jgi:hypothetical protein
MEYEKLQHQQEKLQMLQELTIIKNYEKEQKQRLIEQRNAEKLAFYENQTGNTPEIRIPVHLKEENMHQKKPVLQSSEKKFPKNRAFQNNTVNLCNFGFGDSELGGPRAAQPLNLRNAQPNGSKMVFPVPRTPSVNSRKNCGVISQSHPNFDHQPAERERERSPWERDQSLRFLEIDESGFQRRESGNGKPGERLRRLQEENRVLMESQNYDSAQNQNQGQPRRPADDFEAKKQDFYNKINGSGNSEVSKAQISSKEQNCFIKEKSRPSSRPNKENTKWNASTKACPPAPACNQRRKSKRVDSNQIADRLSQTISNLNSALNNSDPSPNRNPKTRHDEFNKFSTQRFNPNYLATQLDQPNLPLPDHFDFFPQKRVVKNFEPKLKNSEPDWPKHSLTDLFQSDFCFNNFQLQKSARSQLNMTVLKTRGFIKVMSCGMDFVYSNPKVCEGSQARSVRSQKEAQVQKNSFGNGQEWFDDICLEKKEISSSQLTIVSGTDNKSKKFYSEGFSDDDGPSLGFAANFDKKNTVKSKPQKSSKDKRIFNEILNGILVPAESVNGNLGKT